MKTTPLKGMIIDKNGLRPDFVGVTAGENETISLTVGDVPIVRLDGRHSVGVLRVLSSWSLISENMRLTLQKAGKDEFALAVVVDLHNGTIDLSRSDGVTYVASAHYEKTSGYLLLVNPNSIICVRHKGFFGKDKESFFVVGS